MMFERESEVKGYTKKGWVCVKVEWIVKNV